MKKKMKTLNDNTTLNTVQEGVEIKKDLPIKNAMTDDAKNSAAQTPGLNQALTSRDDLLPSDGDNLTI
ncbi:MAG: hypothetical protein ABIN36_17075 [Ferruginibacter sp.]